MGIGHWNRFFEHIVDGQVLLISVHTRDIYEFSRQHKPNRSCDIVDLSSLLYVTFTYGINISYDQKHNSKG